MTIQEKAKELARCFEIASRGSDVAHGKLYARLKEGSPQWAMDIVREAHGDMFPDDYIYEYVRNSAEIIADMQDYENDNPELDPDVYTSDLLTWLGSNINRPCYVDEAVKESGHSDLGIIGDIMQGQVAEKGDIFGIVSSSLEELIKKDDD